MIRHEPLPARLDLDPQLLLDPDRGVAQERLVDRLAAERPILLELIPRHEEIAAGGVEAARPRVGGQLVHVDFHAKQLPQRVAILAAVEPPQERVVALIGQSLPSRHHRMGEIVEQFDLAGRLKLLRVGRRHLAGVERIEHLLPPLGHLDRVDRPRERVDAKRRLRIVGPVAVEAVLGE